MRLFNKTIDRQLFKQYSLGSDLSKQEVVAKIFNPYGNGTWFILNSDPEDPEYLWAIVDLGYGAEVGSVGRSELENYRNRMGWGFERDLSFDPVNALELYNGLSEGKYYADGGDMQGKDTWQNIFEEFGFKKGRSKYGLDMYYKRGYIASVDHELRNVDLMFEDDVLYRGFSVQGLLSALENQFGKRNFADGGGVNVGYNVFNYTDNIYATDKVFKTKALANKFIKEFRSRYANQGYYRDNRMNKINIQDIDLLAIPTDFNPFKKYADGGNISDFTDNQQMIMNQNVELEHHHEELEDILKDEMPVPAWVVAKMATATQSISDVTHYLDGEKELMEDEMEDENEEEDEDQDEIENKIVVEPIDVSAGTKTDLTKNFTDEAMGNLRGFLKGMEGVDLRDDYTFDYKDEQYEVEPIINSDENGVSNAVFSIFDGDGEEVGDVTYSREGGKQKFTANSEFFSWNNAKFEDGGFMNNVYADGGYFDGTIPKVSTYMSNYAKGGSLGTVNPKYKNSILSMINYKIDKRIGDSMSDISYTEALNLKNKINKNEPISSKEKNYISEMASYLSSKRILDKVANISYTESFDFFDNIVSMAKGGEVAKGEILGLKRNFMGTTDVEMKISGMRKPQRFSVYPIGKDDSDKIITIQSETRIGKIDLSSGRGLMSQSHSNGAYFVHFQMDKLTPFTISESDLEDLKMQIFKTAGDNVGSRGIVTDNSGASSVYAKGGDVDDYISMKRLLSEFKNEKEIFDGQIVNRGTNDFKIENDNFYIKRPNENWKIFRKIKFADGGETEEGVDLFEDYDNIPPKLQAVLDKYEYAFQDGDYRDLEKALKAVNAMGYTFEYYLDGQAYDLRKIGQKGKSEVEEYSKGGGIDYHKFYEVSASTKNGYDLYKINGIEDQDVFIGNYKSIKEANQAGEKLGLEKRPMWLRYGKGGVMSNFEKLSAKVAKNYEGKPVKKEFQKEYGKVYSKAEAKEVGDKVAGKVKAMQPAKKEMGGETKKRSGSEMLKQANILAKKIRKDGESWNDAKKRAFAQLKK